MLRKEARDLKEVVAEQALELRLLKKSIIADGCQSARNGDPGSASKGDPFMERDVERPTGWSWSGLRSPVGRVGGAFRL